MHINGIAGHAHNPFYQALVSALGINDNHVTPTRVSYLSQRDLGKRDFDVIGQFIHPDLVAIEQCRLHGGPGYRAQIRNRAFEKDNTEQQQREMTIVLPELM